MAVDCRVPEEDSGRVFPLVLRPNEHWWLTGGRTPPCHGKYDFVDKPELLGRLSTWLRSSGPATRDSVSAGFMVVRSFCQDILETEPTRRHKTQGG